MKATISPSLENYLECIYLLQEKNKVVRVKDLANALELKMASVVGGLKSLAKKGLVIHERYGHIELTQQGLTMGMEVYRRHQVLLEFFQGILNVSPDQAEKDACAIEHYISHESLRRLVRLIGYFKDHSKEEFFQTFREQVAEAPVAPAKPLSSFRPGQKARILKIEGGASLKRKLLDMGMVPGAEVKIENAAPFGSPIIIKVRGSNLSLRREELGIILAEPV